MRARTAFCEFFRDAYQPLVRDVIFAGGNPDEAEDAVSAAMVAVLQRWDAIGNPRAYARRTAINNMIKSRQRGLQRISARLIQRGDVPTPARPIRAPRRESRGLPRVLPGDGPPADAP